MVGWRVDLASQAACGWIQTQCRRDPQTGFSWGMQVRAQGRLLPKYQDKKCPNHSANPPLRYRILPRKSVLFLWGGWVGGSNLSGFNLRGNTSTTHTAAEEEDGINQWELPVIVLGEHVNHLISVPPPTAQSDTRIMKKMGSTSTMLSSCVHWTMSPYFLP